MSDDGKGLWPIVSRIYYVLATPIYVAKYLDVIIGAVLLAAAGATAIAGLKYSLALIPLILILVLAHLRRRKRRQALSPVIKLSAISAPASVGGTLERIIERRVIRVGCIVARPWFAFPDHAKSPTGIYPTILDDIAERHKLSIVYIPIRNNVVFEQLDACEVDMVAQLLQTDERARRAEFAAYIHNVAMTAVVRKGQKRIKCVADLSNKGVRGAVVKGEIGSEIAPRHYGMTEENDRLVILNTSDVPSVFYLIHGEVDVAITTAARWRELQVRDPQVADDLEPAFPEPLLRIPAGTLIKRGESEFGRWLERETAITRAIPEFHEEEDRLLAEFGSAIVRI